MMQSTAAVTTDGAGQPGWQRWLLRLGKITFTLAIAVQLADVAWMLVAPQPVVLPAPAQGTADQGSSGQVAGTADYHFFGEAGAEPVTPVQQTVDAPDTKLRLELLGVTVASQDQGSGAIIAPKNGAGEFYRVGDRIQGRTQLAAVYKERVILDTNGKLETLKFEEHSRRGVSARAVTPPPSRSVSLRDRFREVRSPSDFLEMTTDAAAQDPQGAIRELGLRSNGPGQGYQVQSGSMLSALNLRPGDIVLSVNGQRLGDASADQMVLQQVRDSGQARIEVQRGNQRFTVNHSLN
ncbi:hypothetical protein CHH28_01275 [Bacterioplanes sanyensis]|uniref:PDZ domain-containing protein n=1 Tax=Bacterioplanes sanyensis TaxID=1249553 RepID=A0A222FFX1_9GAMM|nr:type II secretion system protein N [Bacterioplanes sanyensis]ASP37394.1 hypothetical protein CHH28_01275 [Bacterioplanes sanyensis]